LIAGVIAGFVFQTISIREQSAKLPEKIKEFESHSVEDTAKELGVSEQQVKELERSVDSNFDRIQKVFPKKPTEAESKRLKELKGEIVKKNLLQRYFVWGKVRPFILDGYNIKGLFGHLWLHGGIVHLLGNLLFLWIFGNAVCAKIGNIAFFPIYIILGILAGTAHSVFQGGACIGASGAIMGVVGMYLVFFPANNITCYFIFLLIYRPIVREFTLSSYWIILFWLAFDIYGVSKEGGGVAYFAHLGGFATGFVLAVLMLKTKWITMERYEESLLQIWQKRKEPVAALPGSNPRMFPYDLEIQKSETFAIAEREKAEKKTVEPKKIPFELEESKNELIRFMCACGKKVKVPAKYAGKTARCPRCKNRVEIPEK
jgi:membrane associated rhomboid family serine protease